MENKSKLARTTNNDQNDQPNYTLIERCTQIICLWIGFFAATFSLPFWGYIIVFGFLYPPMLLAVPVYLIYMFFDRNTPFNGGRKLNWMRKLVFFKHLRDYFPCELVKTVDLPNDRNYLFIIHPHGLFTLSHIINFASEANSIETEVFPGFSVHSFGVNTHFYGPISREIFLALGVLPTEETSMLQLLEHPSKRKIGVLTAGGFSEGYYIDSSSAVCRLNVGKRKGFVRVALKTGCSLVPVFAFGENYTFDLNSAYTKLASYVNAIILKRFSHFKIVIPKGTLISEYIVDLLPKKVRLTSVVGKPIPVPKVENPSQELIDEYHEKFLQQLQELFDTYKDKYDPSGSEAKLVITR